jgi:hypothetical protein
MTSILSPDDLHKIGDDTEMAKLREALDKKKKHDEDEEAVRAAFMSREVRPDAMERLMTYLQRAATQGVREIKVLEFPAGYCTDHGRAINNFAPDWPQTLDGHAKRAYEWYQKHLEPLGYKTRAEVLTYPEGNLGTIGLFLRW